MNKAREAIERYQDKIRVDEDGTVRWSKGFGPVKAGDPVGKLSKAGVFVFSRDNISVAQFIWELYIGELQPGEKVGHKDGNPRNNHPANLYIIGSQTDDKSGWVESLITWVKALFK